MWFVKNLWFHKKGMKDMLYIECIDTMNCNTLQEGNLYYGFPTGGKALYVSRFPREGSHMGAYQRSRFNILEEEDFIAKKKALETKPATLVSELIEQEVALENEGLVETMNEAEKVSEVVVEEASTEVIKVLNVEKETSEAILKERVYHYQYISPHYSRTYEVYGFINSLGKAVLYKDEALTILIGVTSRENIIVVSELEREINLIDYPVFIKAIKFGDLDDVPCIKGNNKVETVQKRVAEEVDLVDEEISSSEVPLLEEEQEQIVESKLQENIMVESSKKLDEDQYEQLSIFDF